MKRFLSIGMIIMLLLVLVVFSEATQSKSGNFNSNYTLTGVGATDIVNIALAQEGETGSQLGYTEQWCADFVSDCAKLAGQSSAVPANGGTTALKNAIINAGGSVTTSSPKAGDICFIDWGGDGGIDHVEIVYNVVSGKVYTIGGNSGHPSGTNNLYTRYVYKHAPLSSSYIVSIVRPNYSTVHTHNYTVASYEPGCTYDGVYHYYCSCGAEYSKKYKDALGHDFSTLSYCEDAHPHYKVYECSRRCGEKTKSSETSYNSSCIQCNPSAFCANLGDDFYGVILNTACWKPISKEGSNNITLETESGISAQKWRFQRQSDGAYVITSCYDGTTLEMTDGITTNDTQLSAKDGYWGGNYQQWYLIPQSDGLIFLSKHYPGEQWVMDLFENDTSDGNSITIQPRNNTDAQIWNVYTQDEIQLQSAKVTATVDQDKVTFTWPHAYGASSYSLKIWTGGEGWNGQGELYLNAENVKSGYSIDLPAGTYYAYVDSQDYYSFIMSNVVAINISERIPEKPVITSVTSNDEGMVTVEWTECERANSYSLRFYKSGEHYESLIGVAKDTVYWYELPSGTYTVKVTAEGDGYWKDSEMSDEFTVVCENKTPDSEFTCSECGAAFENQVSLDEHLASCNVDGSSGGGGFFSMLINFFYFIIGLLILPFKLIF